MEDNGERRSRKRRRETTPPSDSTALGELDTLVRVDSALQEAVSSVAAHKNSTAALNAALTAHHTATTLSTQQRRARQDVFSRISSVLFYVHPKATLVMQGSFATGISVASSDLDMVVLVDEDVRGVDILRELADELRRYYFVQVISARVPIVKGHSRGSCRVDFDVSCNQREGPATADALRRLFAVDRRVELVLVYLQEVLRLAGVKNSTAGMLSSITVALTLVYYLQREEVPSVLPYPRPTANARSRFTSHTYCNGRGNTKTPAQLLIGYLHWFSETVQASFDDERGVLVDIRHPGEPRCEIPLSRSGLMVMSPVSPNMSVTSRVRQWPRIQTGVQRVLEDLLWNQRLASTRMLPEDVAGAGRDKVPPAPRYAGPQNTQGGNRGWSSKEDELRRAAKRMHAAEVSARTTSAWVPKPPPPRTTPVPKKPFTPAMW